MKEKIIVGVLGTLVGADLFWLIPIPENKRLQVLIVALAVGLIISFVKKKLFSYITTFLLGILLGFASAMQFVELGTIPIAISIILVIIVAVLLTIFWGNQKNNDKIEQ